jgi:hypothetical protein
MKNEVAQEAAKAVPPTTIAGWAWLHGLTISDSVAIATLIYIGLQAVYLLWKWRREWKRSRDGKRV